MFDDPSPNCQRKVYGGVPPATAATNPTGDRACGSEELAAAETTNAGFTEIHVDAWEASASPSVTQNVALKRPALDGATQVRLSPPLKVAPVLMTHPRL